jgi:hypothetical protein
MNWISRGDKQLNLNNIKRKFSHVESGTNFKSLVNLQVSAEEKNRHFGNHKLTSKFFVKPEDEISAKLMKQIDNDIDFILNEDYILNNYNEEYL